MDQNKQKKTEAGYPKVALRLALEESRISASEMKVTVVAVIAVVVRTMLQAMDDERSGQVLVRIDLIEWKES